MQVATKSRFAAAELTADRFGEVEALHDSMGALYPFPDLSNELVTVKTAVTDEAGRIVCAGAVKIIGEAFLWIDKYSNLRDKLNSIGILERDMRMLAQINGFDQVAAWVPPQVPKGFPRLLREMNWQPSPWPTWVKNL